MPIHSLQLVVRLEGVLLLIVAVLCSALIQLCSNGIDNRLYLGELLLELLRRGRFALRIESVSSLLRDCEERLLVVVRHLAAETLLVTKLRLEAVDERGERVERLDASALGLVLGGELLGFADHALDVPLREAALFLGDGDRLRLALQGALAGARRRENEKYVGSPVCRRDLHDTVCVDLEGGLNLRDTVLHIDI